jgi:hypothetical protein
MMRCSHARMNELQSANIASGSWAGYVSGVSNQAGIIKSIRASRGRCLGLFLLSSCLAMS